MGSREGEERGRGRTEGRGGKGKAFRLKNFAIYTPEYNLSLCDACE